MANNLRNNRAESVLLIRLAEGDEAAFAQLYRQYAPKVRTFLNSLRLDAHADDVLQETFLSIWLKRKKIQSDRSFDNYLFAIAKNFALKALKKQLRLELSFNDAMDMADKSSSDEGLLVEEFKETLQRVIERLPDRPREVFQLRKLEGLTTEQISERLGISKSTVENHMNRALHIIRNEISIAPAVIFVLISPALFFS